MKAIDKTWSAFLDPEYSVLRLPHGLGRDGALYLDVTTGCHASRRIWTALEGRARRVRPK
jgi:hypothetical protein